MHWKVWQKKLWIRWRLDNFSQKKNRVFKLTTQIGSGETWKEGYIRLRHESDAKLKLLTQKITKKKAKEDSKSLNTKIAFATGYVKPPRGIRAKQLKVFVDDFEEKINVF